MAQPNHPWKTDKYLEVEDILGTDLGQWLETMRSTMVPTLMGERPMGWAIIARELWVRTDVSVSHETCRNWWTTWAANTPMKGRR